MTRHGTLAYYLAAWVIGCFVVCLMWFAHDAVAGQLSRASELLELYFFALIFGAADILLFAFLLRRLMHWWGTYAVWSWLVAGASLGFVLVLLLGEANSAWGHWNNQLYGVAAFLINALFLAPDALRHVSLWQVPIDGGAIAAVLCLVDRAFNNLTAATPVPPATPETKQATV